MRKVKIAQKLCKTALSKTGVSAYDYTINPYTGCLHACVYCLDGDTLVLMADGTNRPIKDIRAGDQIIGVSQFPQRRANSRVYVRTGVEKVWTASKLAVEITLKNGIKVVCSDDHRWLTERGWKYTTGKMWGTGQRPYLTENNQIRGFGSITCTPPVSSDYMRGYLSGLIRGDGLLRDYDYSGRRRGKDTQHQFRLAMVDASAVRRAYEYLLSFGIKTNWFKFKMKSRRVRCDAIRTNQENLCHRVESLIQYDDTLEWLRGWLGGIFDAEGSGTSGGHTGIIRITNKDKDILQTTKHALDRYRFCYVEESRRTASHIRVRGGRAEYMRFFALTNVTIPRKIALEDTAVKGRMKVARIVPTGKTRLMYDLTTGTGNFVANGLVSHNCYANFMRRFSGHLQDAWGSFVDVKTNLLEVLAKELPRRSGGRVWFSSVCDPYQQVEAKYGLTRGAIELLLGYEKFSISILTKNVLVLRDLDLLSKMKDRVDVGFTITTFNREAQPFFEPYSSPVKERIDALRKLNDAGVDTWVFIAPMLPYVTEVDLEKGLQQVAGAGVKRLMTDRYNARGMIINQTLRAYKSWKPTANLEEIRQLLWKGDEYYRLLDAKISDLWAKETPGGIHEETF